ncbi:MAG TPA: acyltransferase [Gemmatimonadales bacterium]|nr:acyltransferase [Gemmatimonadales bacterium]
MGADAEHHVSNSLDHRLDRRELVRRPTIPELDGLRGIAILLVFLTHFVALYLSPAGSPVDAVVRWVARFGWTGVDLFFVLSGFLITGILLDTRHQPHYWRNYAARRILRIFPLYYGVLVLAFLVVPLVGHWTSPALETLRSNQAWFWAYAVNILQVVKGEAATPLNTSHFWSLCIEEQFYIVWPLVILFASPRGIFRIAFWAIVLGGVFRVWIVLSPLPTWAAYVLTPGRLDGLMIGAALAVLARGPGLESVRPYAKVVALGSGLVTLVLALWRGMGYRDPVVAVVGFPTIAVGFGAALVLSLTGGLQLKRILSHPHLRAWGKYSYGLYLLHFPILGGVESMWGKRMAQMTIAGSHLPGVLVRSMVAVPLAWAAAWASYNLYEKRFLGLKRFFV